MTIGLLAAGAVGLVSAGVQETYTKKTRFIPAGIFAKTGASALIPCNTFSGPVTEPEVFFSLHSPFVRFIFPDFRFHRGHVLPRSILPGRHWSHRHSSRLPLIAILSWVRSHFTRR